MHLWNFFVCGAKFTKFPSPNVEGVAVEQVFFFRCWICRSVLEIFAIKVESSQKSRRNLDVFWRSQILGGWPSKNGTPVITPPSQYVVWKSFVSELPLVAKL